MTALPPARATVARLDTASRWRRFGVDVAAPGWIRLADRLGDGAAMDRWVQDERDGMAAGRRDLAGALIVYRFAGSLAELVVGPMVDQRRVLRLTPRDVWFRLGPAARLDGLAVPDAAVAVAPDDPDAGAGHPDVTVVPGDEGLRAVAAGSLVEVFDPLARAVRARAPYGLAGMWGTLADHIAETAVARAGRSGGDQRHAWQATGALLAALAARQPLLRVRPSLTEVSSPAGAGCFVTKGTCCLVYKVADMCSSCPLRSDADRRARFAAHLRRTGGQ
ncbi:MAG TPA: hypothetical protein VFI47_09815 [Acidimicrobiales bacterium]|nr:hypothetical protein [Acidimicrobiales bacterium]